MKKMNNKGFLLAESLVVSTFVLTVLVLLFVQFRGLFNSYEDSYAYNTVEGIYNLNTMKKYVLNNDTADTWTGKIDGSKYVTIVKNGTCQTDTGLSGLNYCDTLASEMNLKTLLFTSSNISSLNTDSNMFTQSFKDFISRIENVENESRLIGQFGNAEDGYTYATIVFDIGADSNMIQEEEADGLRLYVSNTGSDTNGNGTIDSPYATLNMAYEKANNDAIIYLMSDITVDSTAQFDADKTIIVTNYNEFDPNRKYTIFRGDALTDSALSITAGNVTFDGINFDGNNIQAESALLTITADTNINDATLKNSNNTYTWTSTKEISKLGGAIYASGGEVNISGCEFTYNAADYGGAIYVNDEANVNVDDTTIINNKAATGGGAFCISDGLLSLGTVDLGDVNSADNRNTSNNYLTYNFYVEGGKINDKNTDITIDYKNYKITTALNNNYALDVNGAGTANGTNIQIYSSNDSNAQRWKILPHRIEDNTMYYVFQSQVNGKQYMWVDGNSATSGTNVSTWEFHSSTGGFWSIEKNDDYYQIKNIRGLCLAVKGSNAANSTNVQAYTCSSGNNQKWRFS